MAELKKDNDPVYKNSMVRLLRFCGDESKWPVVLEMLRDASPLVRSNAASALGDLITTPESLKALLAATADESRLVRIRSAISLAALQPKDVQNDRDRRNLNRAVDDFMTAMTARGDDWASYANVGNFYMDRGDYAAAIGYFETAARLEPRQIGPTVNAAIAYSNLGRIGQAEQCLMQALKYEPDNAAANFNLGLLRGEQKRLPKRKQPCERRERPIRKCTRRHITWPCSWALKILIRPSSGAKKCTSFARTNQSTLTPWHSLSDGGETWIPPSNCCGKLSSAIRTIVYFYHPPERS